MLKKWIICGLLFAMIFNLHAKKEKDPFIEVVKKLNELGNTIINASSDSLRKVANNEYRVALIELVRNPLSFNYKFDSLKSISILKANDKIKIYNWALPHVDGTYSYFAFLQIKLDKENFKIIELKDHVADQPLVEQKILSPEQWYGALYYEIIHHKKIGKNYYTLLGWDGNDILSNKKVIDIIELHKNGNVKIGASIFKKRNETVKRVVFEYSENASMSLKYNKTSEKIIFDYLVPPTSNLKGVKAYYGPSLDTFDAFTIGSGKWIYETNTDVLGEKTKNDALYQDPAK